ncbi:MAG: lipid IV(A) 3-deoxy-D-manno-octulosonic acid transferase, partial [Epsilonproteobacteria bacterium]|nr:lipid IV(A) 3-deoxy-D-manno-octulosonic acid transferase [Campylobacterota bacterium]
MFKIFYFITTLLTLIVSLPFLWIISKISSKYNESIPARFWLKNNPSLKPNGIWVHVCSYGEAKSISQLIKVITPSSLRLTAITKTGFDEIRKLSQESRYLPFEPLLAFWIKPQKMLIVLEAELWYLLFLFAKKRGAKTLLVNARMSEKSYPKYLRFKWLYKRIFDNIDEIYVQSNDDAARFRELGAKNIFVTGNIKFANIAKSTKSLKKPDGILVCAASTHENEESLILDGFRSLKSKKTDSKIVVAPRHPERFDKVDKMMSSLSRLYGWSYHRYSQRQDFDSDMVLVDVLGELVNIYAISDLVVLGGAFEPIGGHNALEAAQFGCKIISGENYFNQKEIFNGIDGIKIVTKDELREAMSYPNLLEQTAIKSSAN